MTKKKTKKETRYILSYKGAYHNYDDTYNTFSSPTDAINHAVIEDWMYESFVQLSKEKKGSHASWSVENKDIRDMVWKILKRDQGASVKKITITIPTGEV